MIMSVEEIRTSMIDGSFEIGSVFIVRRRDFGQSLAWALVYIS